jgi:hypothetical protein
MARITLPVPSHSWHFRPLSAWPVPPQTRHKSSPVLGDPGGASSPGFICPWLSFVCMHFSLMDVSHSTVTFGLATSIHPRDAHRASAIKSYAGTLNPVNKDE